MFAISTDHLPGIRTFGNCARYWERTKPWRGTSEHSPRPLGKRAEKHKTVVKYDDSTYALRLYSTDVVTYHADERLSIRCYPTRSTSVFADAVTPTFMNSTMERGLMGVYYKTPDKKEWAWVTAHVNDPLVFERAYCPEGNHNGWTLVNPDKADTFHKTVVNRQRAGEVRKKLAPFEAWVRAVVALSGRDLSNMFEVDNDVHRINYIGERQNRISMLFDSNVTPEDFPHVLRALCHKTYAGKVFVPDSWRNELLRYAYKAAGALDRVELPFGSTPVYDRYK
jgi:hypothetical protein